MSDSPSPYHLYTDLIADMPDEAIYLLTAFLPGTTLVGYALYTVSQAVPHLQRIYVRSSYRHRGIATLLITALQQAYPDHTIDWGTPAPAAIGLRASFLNRSTPTL